MYDCPQCGHETAELHEGYCKECCDENQRNIDIHIAQYVRWQSMTDLERDAAIKQSIATDGIVVE